ncbi:beta-flanking protein [Serpula lacrymans var. lacrymans S7.9]|uniref:Beta-flanking protein n=1 Tax=Serpula lacrymans var. lacrymans (strain S7.9) TaxID=578457 RepID=F8NG89_SERL9|nr:beta-flanking protein [Serpula lacrymans var. lacrymans S7.9]EGO31282.1 beta-flanking protein [Serpula lacrymans var. lacrymans S7.9]
MDTFMNLAKQGYQAYSESHSDVNKTGGQEYNSPHHRPAQDDRPHFDHDEAVHTAQRHAESSGDPGMFAAAMNHVNSNRAQHEHPVDEDEVQNAHRQAYREGGASGLSAGSMGGAAAMQILQKFTSGGGSSGGGGSKTELISMAMAEASKLFDKSGGGSGGSKQDAINGAAMTVMKLVVQSKLGGTTGGSNSGGIGSLMGLGFQIHVNHVQTVSEVYKKTTY